MLFVANRPPLQEHLCFGGLPFLSVQVMENSVSEIVASLGQHHEGCPHLESKYSLEFPKNKSKFICGLSTLT